MANEEDDLGLAVDADVPSTLPLDQKDDVDDALDSNLMQWIFEAIQKIRQQKQRPNVDRIGNAIRQGGKKNVTNDLVNQTLEIAIRKGRILKVFNKGQVSYKDASQQETLHTRMLKITKKSEFLKLLIKSLKELGDGAGSTLLQVQDYVRQSYKIENPDEVDLADQLRLAVPKGLNNGKLLEVEGRLKPVEEPKPTTPPKNNATAQTATKIKDVKVKDDVVKDAVVNDVTLKEAVVEEEASTVKPQEPIIIYEHAMNKVSDVHALVYD